ncbi:MAG TPA: tRNA pseudouridine(55) synthase TruB [Steroidobacteraceae bacterium]|nr:tRNA pseudouridine(55) synthase TruB [Steroidobacteraceae bacterium]
MLSGVLLLDKPEGLSSNAALQRVRRLTGGQKAGHVGSLDPLATGMLPICLGEATKIAGELIGGRKRYRFEIALGTATDTGDREGAVIETAPLPRPAIAPERVAEVLARFRGRQLQVPPMYSALKRGGQPLYRLARAGLEVERAPREIEIDELVTLALGAGSLELEAVCSKGTYIRVLAADLARALGTCGHVGRLRRISVAPFESETMQTLEAIEEACRGGGRPALIAADRALPHLPAVTVAGPGAARLACGQTVASPDPRLAGRVRLYDQSGCFLGLGEADGGMLRPRRMFLVAGGG